MRLEYLVEARYWYASTGSPLGMFAPVAFYFDTDPISSIFYMTWSRGRTVNATRTIVPFQEESSKTFEGC